jgi:hypothetical protein
MVISRSLGVSLLGTANLWERVCSRFVHLLARSHEESRASSLLQGARSIDHDTNAVIESDRYFRAAI